MVVILVSSSDMNDSDKNGRYVWTRVLFRQVEDAGIISTEIKQL